MTATFVGLSQPSLDMVSTFGVYAPFPPGFLITATSTAIPARTEYYALDIPTPHVVRRFWWANGATVSAARTITMALYADAGFKPGAKVGTAGATTQGTANQLQFVAPSGGDFTISPGLWWLAIACDSVTGAPTVFCNAMSQQINAAVAFQEATTPPPTTATPVEKTSTSYFLCGFSTTTLT